MAIRLSFETPDLKAYKKHLVSELKNKLIIRARNLWLDAVGEFTEGVVDSILIDTGMSAGSILPLAKRAEASGTREAKGLTSRLQGEIQGRIEAPKRKGVKFIDGSFDGNLFRTLALGRKLGATASSVKLGNKKTIEMTFTFDITVFQHEFHEPKEQTLQAGLSKFERFIENNFDGPAYLDPRLVAFGMNVYEDTSLTKFLVRK